MIVSSTFFVPVGATAAAGHAARIAVAASSKRTHLDHPQKGSFSQREV
jgi:hypothetical protein